MVHQMIRLKTESDGSIRIPAELAHQAGLGKGREVLLHVSVSRLTLIPPKDPRALFEAFADTIRGELGDLNSSYRMSDGRTVDEYLALSEAQRGALWEDAFQQTMEALEKEPEQDASADYVPAGQRHCAPGVRERRASGRRSPTD